MFFFLSFSTSVSVVSAAEVYSQGGECRGVGGVGWGSNPLSVGVACGLAVKSLF